MKKIIYSLMIVIGISLFAFSIFSINSSAKETELFMELAMDIDEQDYEESTYRLRRLRGHRGPLLFIGLGETVKNEILEQAADLDIEVRAYILAKTVSTYDERYDFETVVATIKDLSGDALDGYLEELNQVLVDASEDIKTSLDQLKDTYMPQIEQIKETYQDDVRALIQEIKNADETSKQTYIDELEVLKLQIQADMSLIQEAFLEDLEEENIAVEGLYGLFIQRTQNRFEARMDMLEKRNPQLYNRIKHHFNR